jgi:Tol biopolymer transport system component
MNARLLTGVVLLALVGLFFFLFPAGTQATLAAGASRRVASIGSQDTAGTLPPQPQTVVARGSTHRLASALDGTESNGHSSNAVISADGRFVAFVSEAINLVVSDTNNARDIFVQEIATGVISRASLAANGAQANRGSLAPSISADGRFVAFVSTASNLVMSDTNDVADVFVHDRALGTTSLVSWAVNGQPANNYSHSSVISADGRFVSFISEATNLVSDDTNSLEDIFVRDLENNITTRVSVTTGGGQALGGPSGSPMLSADGRYVVFDSEATNLVPGDTNAVPDVFLHDRQTITTSRLSLGYDGGQADNSAYAPTISADGRFIGFISEASNLIVGGPSDGMSQVYVLDRNTGSYALASVGMLGEGGNASSSVPLLSANGRFVAFESYATNLITDTNNRLDIFMYDLSLHSISLVSVATDATQANGDSQYASLSGDGRLVAFDARATNLVAGDHNAFSDVFLRDRLATNLPGDVNEDCLVDAADIQLITAMWRQPAPSLYDLDGDRRITLMDIMLAGNHFGTICS